jgi:hypothetical protein
MRGFLRPVITDEPELITFLPINLGYFYKVEQQFPLTRTDQQASKGYPSKGFHKPLKGMDAFQERHGWLHACLRKLFDG